MAETASLQEAELGARAITAIKPCPHCTAYRVEIKKVVFKTALCFYMNLVVYNMGGIVFLSFFSTRHSIADPVQSLVNWQYLVI